MEEKERDHDELTARLFVGNTSLIGLGAIHG